MSHEVDELLAGVDAQFCVDMLGVGGRRLAADDELVADVGDGTALGEQREHLGLARGVRAADARRLVDARAPCTSPDASAVGAVVGAGASG